MQYNNKQKGIIQHKKSMWLRHRLVDPFIWTLIIPLFIVDIFLEMYHYIGFRLYGIPKVKRSEYIKIDRYKLKYLNPGRKIACIYCGYVNGFLGYALEITARTENYWCAIKHDGSGDFIEPKHHEKFVEYGDKESYKKRYPKL